jgi:hypothetical protein
VNVRQTIGNYIMAFSKMSKARGGTPYTPQAHKKPPTKQITGNSRKPTSQK